MLSMSPNPAPGGRLSARLQFDEIGLTQGALKSKPVI
jgi:hypothetical protein